MANTVSLTYTVASDSSTATITDSTSFVSPLRSACGVFLNVYKTNYQGAQTELTCTLDNANANSTSQWTFDLDSDGWHQAYYVSIPDYSTIVTYAQHAAVFDPSTQLVYKSKLGSNLNNSVGNTTYWEVVSDPALLAANEGTATESTNIDSQIGNKIYNVHAEAARDRYAVDVAAEMCGDYSLDSDVNLFELFDLFVEGMASAEEYGEFVQGERIARRADALTE